MADGEIAGCGPGGARVTCCVAAIASAAARHFDSFGKSRNDVAVPTPPFDDPLTRKITKIKVHILCSIALENSVVGRYGLRRANVGFVCSQNRARPARGARGIPETPLCADYPKHHIALIEPKAAAPGATMKRAARKVTRYGRGLVGFGPIAAHFPGSCDPGSCALP
jgi:hypothetical protein